MKNMLIKWISDVETNPANGETIEFTRGAFTQLYDEALKLKSDHRKEVKIGTVKGIVIGITLVGLAEFGVNRYNSFKERYLDEVYQKIDEGDVELVKEVIKVTNDKLDELNS